MMRRGFTVVELVITITIMGILLTLAVVSLNATQANARDSERKADVESIALNLENYYSSETTTADGDIYMSGGTYPGTTYVSNDTTFASILPDIDPKSTRAPGIATAEPKSLVVATTNALTPSTITPTPSAANDIYVYQPIQADGTLCTDPSIANSECRRFYIYFFQESDNSVHVITSKHQS